MSFGRIGIACLLLSGLAFAQDNPFQTLIDNTAPAIVTVKAVQSISITMAGRGAQEEEDKVEMRGVVVDPSGLVMVSDSGLNNGAIARMFGDDPRIDIAISTNDIFVVFENEETEYTARLVATDTELDLAFLMIDELEGRELTAIDFSQAGGEAAIGSMVYGVTRFGRSFDFAPYFTRAMLSGKVKKPRKLWHLTGAIETGLPLFTEAGALLGVGITVLPDGEEGQGLGARLAAAQGGAAVMLLATKKVHALIERAKQQAAELDQEEGGTEE